MYSLLRWKQHWMPLLWMCYIVVSMVLMPCFERGVLHVDTSLPQVVLSTNWMMLK